MYFYKEDHFDYDPINYNPNENEFIKEFEEKESFFQIGDFSTDPDDFDKKDNQNKINENMDINNPIYVETVLFPEKKEEKTENMNLTLSLEKEILQENIKDLNENEEEEISKTFLSNKTKNSGENSFNNKFKDDNIRRKCKHLVLDSIFDFINNKIIELYNNNIGKGIFKKQLQNLNKKQKSESNIKFNQEFLNRTIKDIFSDDISKRIYNYPKDFNKKLIENLLNENDFNKKDYFNNLFNLTFIQCLEHYIGINFHYELKGMRTFEDEINNFTDDENYARYLEYYLRNYQCIINNKKSRKKKGS